MDVFEVLWMDLQRQIDALYQRVDDLTQVTARAETVGGFASFAYAARPLAATGGMQVNNTAYVDMGFCYDARKSGEGAGAGTGVPCYYDPVVNDWRRFEDNAILTV